MKKQEGGVRGEPSYICIARESRHCNDESRIEDTMKRQARMPIGTVVSLAVAILLAAAGMALAQDRQPLVIGGDGNSTTVNDLISSTTPDELLAQIVVLPAATPHSCHVFASAGALRAGGTAADGAYFFGLRDGGLSTDLPSPISQRAIMFPSALFMAVSTNQTFTNLTGTHTFRFSARKQFSSDLDMTVTESSMSVICVQKTL
jgi:hypothetical protein